MATGSCWRVSLCLSLSTYIYASRPLCLCPHLSLLYPHSPRSSSRRHSCGDGFSTSEGLGVQSVSEPYGAAGLVLNCICPPRTPIFLGSRLFGESLDRSTPYRGESPSLKSCLSGVASGVSWGQKWALQEGGEGGGVPCHSQ